MEVQRACPFQDAAQLNKPRCHVDEVGHRVVLTEQRPEGAQRVSRTGGYAAGDSLAVLLVGDRGRPMPRVIERFDLSRVGSVLDVMPGEDDVVVPVRVERRV